MKNMKKGLYIVSTPIGNLGDITERAKDILNLADYIFCENPNHSIKLLNNLGIKKKLIGIHDYNEISIIKEYSSRINKSIVALISDAGSPLISDPGYKLVRHCLQSDIFVTVIPGPTSIIAALQLSSFPINEFYYAGFIPKSRVLIKKYINEILTIDKTTIFLLPSRKVSICLDILEEIIEDRKICIAKELTKINEDFFIDYPKKLKKLILEKKINLKGEFIIVIEAKDKKKSKNYNTPDIDEEISKLLLKYSLTDVVQIVHKISGLPKTKVYKKVLGLKNE